MEKLRIQIDSEETQKLTTAENHSIALKESRSQKCLTRAWPWQELLIRAQKDRAMGSLAGAEHQGGEPASKIALDGVKEEEIHWLPFSGFSLGPPIGWAHSRVSRQGNVYLFVSQIRDGEVQRVNMR